MFKPSKTVLAIMHFYSLEIIMFFYRVVQKRLENEFLKKINSRNISLFFSTGHRLHIYFTRLLINDYLHCSFAQTHNCHQKKFINEI